MYKVGNECLKSTAAKLTAGLLVLASAESSALAETASSGMPATAPGQELLATPLPATPKAKGIDDPDGSRRPVSSLDSEIAIGDHLKISVYMAYGSGNGLNTDNQGTLPTLIAQPDLSGEYVVQQSGEVFLPIAGSVKVLGVSLPDATHAIETAFAKHQTGALRVGLQILERQPVYVTGNIPSPATIRHTPGMTVLQAAIMAGAGQSLNAADRRLRDLDLMREQERVQQSSERLAKALARRAVLSAERDGKASTIPSELSQLVSSQADAILSEAESLRKSELSKSKEQDVALDASLEAMKHELAVLQNSVTQTESWIQDLEGRVQILEPIYKKGTISTAAMFTARADLITAQEKAQETKTNIARLARDMAATSASKTLLAVNSAFEREKSLEDINGVIHQEQITRATMGRFLVMQGGATTAVGLADNPGPPQYKILRQTVDGQKELLADEATELLPGDILQILSPNQGWKWSLAE